MGARRASSRGLGAQHDQRLPVLDWRGISDENLHDGPAATRGNRVHQLHYLDDANDRIGIHDLADLDERFCAWLRRAVERPDHGGADDERPLRPARRVEWRWDRGPRRE